MVEQNVVDQTVIDIRRHEGNVIVTNPPNLAAPIAGPHVAGTVLRDRDWTIDRIFPQPVKSFVLSIPHRDPMPIQSNPDVSFAVFKDANGPVIRKPVARGVNRFRRNSPERRWVV